MLRLAAAARPALSALSRRQCSGAAVRSTSIFEDKHLFPDQVAEEEKTGLAAGLPMTPEAETWANPDKLLPERLELWWDDGTAHPEWFVDHEWPVSTATAAAQAGGALLFIFTFVGGGAWLLGDGLRPAAKRWDHGFPTDMRAQYGMASTSEGEDEDEDDE